MLTLSQKIYNNANSLGQLKEGANYFTGQINFLIHTSTGHSIGVTSPIAFVLTIKDNQPASINLSIGICNGAVYMDASGLLNFTIGFGNANELGLPTIFDFMVICKEEDVTSTYIQMLNNIIVDYTIYKKSEFFIDGEDAN
jgi:hypothetical protein